MERIDLMWSSSPQSSRRGAAIGSSPQKFFFLHLVFVFVFPKPPSRIAISLPYTGLANKAAVTGVQLPSDRSSWSGSTTDRPDCWTGVGYRFQSQSNASSAPDCTGARAHLSSLANPTPVGVRGGGGWARDGSGRDRLVTSSGAPWSAADDVVTRYNDGRRTVGQAWRHFRGMIVFFLLILTLDMLIF